PEPSQSHVRSGKPSIFPTVAESKKERARQGQFRQPEPPAANAISRSGVPSVTCCRRVGPGTPGRADKNWHPTPERPSRAQRAIGTTKEATVEVETRGDRSLTVRADLLASTAPQGAMVYAATTPGR